MNENKIDEVASNKKNVENENFFSGAIDVNRMGNSKAENISSCFKEQEK